MQKPRLNLGFIGNEIEIPCDHANIKLGFVDKEISEST